MQYKVNNLGGCDVLTIINPHNHIRIMKFVWRLISLNHNAHTRIMRAVFRIHTHIMGEWEVILKK